MAVATAAQIRRAILDQHLAARAGLLWTTGGKGTLSPFTTIRLPIDAGILPRIGARMTTVSSSSSRSMAYRKT